MSEHSFDRERIPGIPRYKTRTGAPAGTEPFWPNFLLKEWVVGSVFLACFIIWVIFNPTGLGGRANPDNTSYIPMPDWYFYFLYQILKYYPGAYVAIGTIVVPGIAVTLLMLAPWFDLGKVRHPTKRFGATVGIVLTTVFMIYLTWEADTQHKTELAVANGTPTSTYGGGFVQLKTPSNTALVDTSDPGAAIFKQTCSVCHGVDLKGVTGPVLLGIGNVKTEKQLVDLITHGFPPNMPARGGLSSDAQVKEIAAWLAKQKQK